ncbi:MAG: signal peptidase I [Saprospiraceae bacterium]
MLVFFLVSYLLLSAGLYFIFKKANVDAWKALVPGWNFAIWCELIGRKSHFALWLLFPVVNIFIYAGMCVDMARSFKNYGFGQSVLAVIFSPLYFLYLGLSAKEAYDGPTLEKERVYQAKIDAAKEAKNDRLIERLAKESPYKKSGFREWTEAIVFAVFAATFIRMFLIEAYVIPTSSMEGSLLVGDFLFVSKAHYGIRMPQTIAMLPLLHNRIPLVGGESYLEKPSLPYMRLKALESVDRNEPVVFNYPEGDSVCVFPNRTWSIHDFRRGMMDRASYEAIRSGQAPLVTRPMDKKDHYIKRCVGQPGDSLQVINRQLYVNGEPAKDLRYIQFLHHLRSPSGPINERNFSDWGISPEDVFRRDPNNNSMLVVLGRDQIDNIKKMDPSILLAPCKSYSITILPGGNSSRLTAFGIDNANIIQQQGASVFEMYLTDEEAAQAAKDSLVRITPSTGQLFPHDPVHFATWSRDDYGPIWVPKKGVTVQISPQNISLYRRIIGVYEGNELKETNGKIFINGAEATSYTFKMDYYWMMGDNRHNSEDARVWGFVPEDHIVGKPLFIWFSLKEGGGKGINWKRIFTGANKM